MQRLSDEQNKNRNEACEKSSWEIENRLYRSLNSSQIENQFNSNSSIDVVIDTTPDVTSFDEFTVFTIKKKHIVDAFFDYDVLILDKKHFWLICHRTKIVQLIKIDQIQKHFET